MASHSVRNQDGMVLVISLLVLISLSAIALGLMLASTLENTIAGNNNQSNRAFQNAEGGLEMARNILLDYRDNDQGFTKLLSQAQGGTDPELNLADVGLDAQGDPIYSPGTNVYGIPISRYELILRDDSDDPLEDNDDKRDTNFAVIVQSVGYGPAGNARKTITAKLRYGDSKDYAQDKQNKGSTGSKYQTVATGVDSSTDTFKPN